MKTIDEILDDLSEERPQDLHEQTTPARTDPEEEDVEEMLADCHTLLTQLKEFDGLPAEIQREIRQLSLRLQDVLEFHTFH